MLRHAHIILIAITGLSMSARVAQADSMGQTNFEFSNPFGIPFTNDFIIDIPLTGHVKGVVVVDTAVHLEPFQTLNGTVTLTLDWTTSEGIVTIGFTDPDKRPPPIPPDQIFGMPTAVFEDFVDISLKAKLFEGDVVTPISMMETLDLEAISIDKAIELVPEGAIFQQFHDSLVPGSGLVSVAAFTVIPNPVCWPLMLAGTLLTRRRRRR